MSKDIHGTKNTMEIIVDENNDMIYREVEKNLHNNNHNNTHHVKRNHYFEKSSDKNISPDNEKNVMTSVDFFNTIVNPYCAKLNFTPTQVDDFNSIQLPKPGQSYALSFTDDFSITPNKKSSNNQIGLLIKNTDIPSGKIKKLSKSDSHSWPTNENSSTKDYRVSFQSNDTNAEITYKLSYPSLKTKHENINTLPIDYFLRESPEQLIEEVRSDFYRERNVLEIFNSNAEYGKKSYYSRPEDDTTLIECSDIEYVQRPNVELEELFLQARSDLEEIQLELSSLSQKFITQIENNDDGELEYHELFFAYERWTIYFNSFLKGHQNLSCAEDIISPPSWTVPVEGRPPPEEPEKPSERIICAVCFQSNTFSIKLGDEEESNPIVYCDGCDCTFHSYCYGSLTHLDSPTFYCDICTYYRSTNRAVGELPKCILCNQVGGAMKIFCGDKFVHICCTFWYPGIYFKDLIHLKDIFIENALIPYVRDSDECEFQEIILDNDRYQLFSDLFFKYPVFRKSEHIKIAKAKCYYCGSSKGIHIKCMSLNCNNYFHFLCAYKEGCSISVERNKKYDKIVYGGGGSIHNYLINCVQCSDPNLVQKEKELRIPLFIIPKKLYKVCKISNGLSRMAIYKPKFKIVLRNMRLKPDVYNEDICTICFCHYPDKKCYKCGTKFHRTCYPDSSISNVNFLCDKCLYNQIYEEVIVDCKLCPRTGGMLKITHNEKFVHVFCAKINNCTLKNHRCVTSYYVPKIMESESVCRVCKEAYGGFIYCGHEGCNYKVHHLCGIFNGDIFILTNFQMELYCEDHKPNNILYNASTNRYYKVTSKTNEKQIIKNIEKVLMMKNMLYNFNINYDISEYNDEEDRNEIIAEMEKYNENYENHQRIKNLIINNESLRIKCDEIVLPDYILNGGKASFEERIELYEYFIPFVPGDLVVKFEKEIKKIKRQIKIKQNVEAGKPKQALSKVVKKKVKMEDEDFECSDYEEFYDEIPKRRKPAQEIPVEMGKIKDSTFEDYFHDKVEEKSAVYYISESKDVMREIYFIYSYFEIIEKLLGPNGKYEAIGIEIQIYTNIYLKIQSSGYLLFEDLKQDLTRYIKNNPLYNEIAKTLNEEIVEIKKSFYISPLLIDDSTKRTRSQFKNMCSFCSYEIKQSNQYYECQICHFTYHNECTPEEFDFLNNGCLWICYNCVKDNGEKLVNLPLLISNNDEKNCVILLYFYEESHKYLVLFTDLHFAVMDLSDYILYQFEEGSQINNILCNIYNNYVMKTEESFMLQRDCCIAKQNIWNEEYIRKQQKSELM